MPTRKPVKLPGPVVTTTRSRSLNNVPDFFMTRAMSGISASAWPRTMAKISLTTMPPRIPPLILGLFSASTVSTAAEQAPSAVSMASTRMEDQTVLTWRDAPELHRPDFGDVGYEMAQQILDAVLQRRRRGWATCARALHIEKDDAIFEAAEGDVAAVVGYSRTDACFDQFLNRGDRFGVGGIEKFVDVVALGAAGGQERRARHVMFHDGPEDHRLELLPLADALGHGNEIGSEKHPADAGNGKQPFGGRRLRGLFAIAQVESAVFEHCLSGQELQGRRVRRRFGLDEHGSLWRFAPF